MKKIRTLLNAKEIKELAIEILLIDEEENTIEALDENDDEDFEEIFGVITEYASQAWGEEEIDSNYIHTIYKFDVNGKIYEVSDSAYRKDMSVCEAEWNYEVVYLKEVEETKEEKIADLTKKINSTETKLAKLKKQLEDEMAK